MSWYDIIFSEGKDLYTMETAVRTAIIFILSFILIRIAKKRFLGRNTAFDIVLGVISGSVASRAINGSAKLFPTAASLVVLIILHWIVSFFVSRNSWFANIAEGKPAKCLKMVQLTIACLNGIISGKWMFMKQHGLKAISAI
jgi:hypothetical protein